MTTKKIRVHVVHYADCKNIVLRYIDPATGKPVRRTKYKDPQTGEEIETGTNDKFAKKLAARWEADLNAGRDQGRHATSWEQFRRRYEDEVVPGLADRTAKKITTVFNAVAKALPRIANGKLTDLNPEALSLFQAELRSRQRSENTIASYLAHLRSALQWAMDQGMLFQVPKIKRPQRAKKGRKAAKGKGRPITAEEFERMLEKVPAAIADMKRRKREGRKAPADGWKRGPYEAAPVELDPQAVASWRHYLRGLWLSGLRLEESLNLYWDRSDRPCIELRGKRPMLRIPAECEKGHQDRLLPITPDFAQFLLATPEADRRGRVFVPMAPTGLAGYDAAGRTISLIGELAGVKVHTHPRTGKIKFASAHDLRRSFGNRWAKKVMPAVLQKLMRHESIETTMGYYVDLDADELAEDLYRAHEQGQNGREGTVFGTVGQSDPRNGGSESEEENALSDDNTSGFGLRK